jgi:molybdopterin-containing oxidoreductase family membrane subunit
MRAITYTEIHGHSAGYYGLVAVLVAMVLAGTWAAHYMEVNGHHVTGMSNQIVWGTPHVFAVFLIVAASGALNVASVASVFGRDLYKPMARFSGLLAIALLLGGLAVLVLDLGRPDRIVVAMTTYNFKSIFAWNIFLYTGFLAIVVMYLWVQMERRFEHYTRPVGMLALAWRLVLTTGTGSIFGFLVAREAYDAAIMGPLFIAMSFSFGTAVFILVLMGACRWTGRVLGHLMLQRLKRLLAIFVIATLYMVAVFHLTNLYIAEHQGVERFILMDGGSYTLIFWLGQVLVGALLPLAIFYWPGTARAPGWIAAGAGLVVLGGFAQIYVIIIGGQAYPLEIFPGKEIIASSFFDGVVTDYRASLPEILLGVGGVALALLVVTLGIKVLRFLPDDPRDDTVGSQDPRQTG